MSKKNRILTINPGSTSTKIGIFDDETKIFETTLRHSSQLIEKFPAIWDQYNLRKEEIVNILKKNNYDISKFDAVVGRGGLIKPIPNGTYAVDQEMVHDARIGLQGHHASNLGCVIAYSLAWEYNIPSFIVDPPSVNDLEDLAKISGNAEINRTSIFHALNIFATARNFAKDQKKNFNNLNLIVAHLGGGISVAAIRNGRAINSNSGLQEGPFSPERSGSLPPLDLIEMAYSGKYTKEQMKKMIVGKGGLVSYFGTNKAVEVENMVLAGSKKHKLVYEAMAYQIAQEIGARATNLNGKVDAIIITGGLANSKILVEWIKERVEFLAKTYIYPGELELEALASGALRVLRGEEAPKHYDVHIPKIGIYYWQNIEAYISAINNIEDFFREKGYIFRKDNSNLVIEYGNCKGNEDRAKLLAERFIDLKVDAVFAVGSPASIRIAQYLSSSGIPVVFTGIYNENVLNLYKQIKDTCYFVTAYSVPFKEQFENTINKISPDIKKIGITYQNGELQSNIEHDEVREFCKNNKIECVSFDIQAHEDLAKASEIFKKEKVQWVFLGSDSIIATATPKQIETISKTFPTLCALQDTATHGGLISFSIPWKTICNNAADIGFKILNNIEVKRSIVNSTERIISVNKETSEKFKDLEILSKIENYKIV